MEGEKNNEQTELAAVGLDSNSIAKLSLQDEALTRDGVPSDLISSMSLSGNAASGVKVETHQESVAEQGVYYPPNSCYIYYYYPGLNGNFTKMDHPGYSDVGAGAKSAAQLENGSLLCYLPGFEPYASGTFMGVDGRQPYFTSSEYLQQPVSYGSEAMPCYSWDSAYAGDVANGPRNVRSGPGSNISARSSGFNFVKASNSNNRNAKNLPLDSKSRLSTALPNFSKFGYGTKSAGLANGFAHDRKLPSSVNQNQGVFAHSGAMNYRQNSMVWNSNDKFKSRENSDRGGAFAASNELCRGPRANNRIKPSNGLAGHEKLGLAVQKDQYNLEDFQTEYDIAKFYIIKSYSEDDIHKCIKYDVWSSTPNGNKKLDAGFRDAELKPSESSSKCPIFLFFSVNGSGQFLGLAEMIGQVDFKKNMDFWQSDKWNGFFPVKWHIIKDIPNSVLRHITLENNDDRPVTHTRDTQEVGLKQGLEMLKIFKTYLAKSSILDDFNFYENREKLHKAKGSNKPAPQKDIYQNNGFHRQFVKAREPIIKEIATSHLSEPASLIKPHPQSLP